MADQPFRAYDELAIAAAQQAGLITADQRAEALRKRETDDAAYQKIVHDAAENPKTRGFRDRLWAELERRLRDRQTYTLDDIHRWMTYGEPDGLGCTLGRTSLHRLQKHLVAKEEQIARRARLAAEVARQAAGHGGGLDEMLRASMGLAAQTVFDMLTDLPDEATTVLKPNHLIGLLEMVARLHTARAQADYTDQRVAELQRKFDDAVAARQALVETGGRRELTAEDIRAIRESVFGVAVDAA